MFLHHRPRMVRFASGTLLLALFLLGAAASSARAEGSSPEDLGARRTRLRQELAQAKDNATKRRILDMMKLLSEALEKRNLLGKGARGELVKALQRLLREAGFDVAVDGDFGPKTEAALKALQRQMGLEPTGLAGPATLAALEDAMKGKKSLEEVRSGKSVLEKGMFGPAVAELQRMLTRAGFPVGATGKFGDETERQLREFQKKHGIAQTGKVGPTTLPFLEKFGAPKVSVPLKVQDTSVGCGQTSVAMVVEALTGKPTERADIAASYGFGLLGALETETGLDWRSPDFSTESWTDIQASLAKGRPVIIGLGGSTFTSGSTGHIVVITGVNGDTVTYADPADGQLKTTTRQVIEQDPGHSEGKFLFIAP